MRRRVLNQGFPYFLTFAVLAILIPRAALAQAPTLALSAASITIDPTATDSYDLQGRFSGLQLTGASYVWLSVGNFSAEIPFDQFVQQARTNVYTYQDSTGQAPAWVSTLTLDLDAQTFEAHAPNIVLSGLSNPFVVHLGTDQGAGCTVVRVQQGSAGSYRLTPNDPAGMTCELSNLPASFPTVTPVNTPTDVTVTTGVLTFSGSGVPHNPQVFRSDDNGQPVGDPLCSMSVQTDGSYSCTATFNEANPGVIPLLLQATVAGQTIFSPGFSLQAVAPPTADDVAQLQSIEGAMAQAYANFAQYGDSAYSRTLTLTTLRQVLEPEPTLTGTQIALCPNGLDISVQLDAGLPVTLILNDLGDGQITAANPQVILRKWLRIHRSSTAISRQPPIRPATTDQTQQCGMPQRDIVWNNNVLIWDPGPPGRSFFGYDFTQNVANLLQKSKCPMFNVAPTILGSAADVASLAQFPKYGTIVMNTHGGQDGYGGYHILTGESSDGFTDFTFKTALLDGLSVGCVMPDAMGNPTNPKNCYVAVLPWSPDLKPLHNNTIVYMGSCYGHEFLNTASPKGAPSVQWALSGTNVAFFDFQDSVFVGDDAMAANAVFDQLLNHYANTGTAWSNAPQPSAPTVFFRMGDSNLSYTGNPSLVSLSGAPPSFSINQTSVLNLKAQLQVPPTAPSCDGTMQYLWSNTAAQGHLTPQAGSGIDKFQSLSAMATYTPIPSGSGPDNLTVDFLPNGSPPPAARACATATVQGCFVEFGGTLNQKVGCAVIGSKASNGNWTLLLTTTGTATQPYATFQLTFASVPMGFRTYGTTSPGVVSASEMLQPAGKGTSPTLTMNVPGGPNDLFVVDLGDLSNPSNPKGNVDALARDPKGPFVANCSTFGCAISVNWYFE